MRQKNRKHDIGDKVDFYGGNGQIDAIRPDPNNPAIAVMYDIMDQKGHMHLIPAKYV